MHRLVRALAVLVTALLLFGGLRVQPTFAQSSNNGITSHTSYESPTFGYTVEWQDPWSALEEQTSVSNTGDLLVLWADDYGARVDIGSYFARGRTAQAFLDSYLELIAELQPDMEAHEDITGTRSNPAYLVTYTLSSGNRVVDHYIEAKVVGDAIVVVEVRGGKNQGLDLASAVAVDVTLNGESSLGSIQSGNDQPEDSGNGNSKTDRPTTRDNKTTTSTLETYESPTFGSTFQYDPKVWTVSDELTADKNDGRDTIILESDLPARIYVENYDDYNGKAAACIDAAAGEAVGDIDKADVLQDENGDDLEGSSRGKTWVAYAFESDSGDALAAYIECRSLPDGAGVFVFTLLTNEDDFADAYAAGLEILDTVSVDGATADAGSTSKTNSGNTASASGSYESPTHGYVLTFDDAEWSVLNDSTRGTTDQLILSGPKSATLYVQGMEASNFASARDCVNDAASLFQESQSYELDQILSSSGKPLAGDNDFGYYTGFEFTDKSGEAFALYVACGASPSEEAYVLFLAFAPMHDLRSLLNNVDGMIEGLEF